MCRGPLAYGQATATRIDCGVRFGEALLRFRRGLGHLTEDVFAQRGPRRDRRGSSPAHDAERAEGEPHEGETEEPGPRTILIARNILLAHAPLNGRVRSRRGPSRRAPNGRFLRGQRARPPLPRPQRRRDGALRPSNKEACPPHRPGRPRAPRGSRRHAPRRTRPWGSSRPRRLRRRTLARPRRSGRTRRRLGLPRGGGRRLHWRGLGTGRRIGGAGLASGEQRQRVEIPMRLGGQPYAEVHRGHAPFVAAELGRGDHVALRDGCADAHAERTEMQKRDRVAVLGPQGDRPPAAGNHSREGDHTGDRSEHVLTRGRRDLDAAMLPGRVGIAFDVEGPEHRAGHGPAPGSGGGRHREGRDDRHQDCPAPASVVSSANHAATVSGPSAVVKIFYSEPR
jgi:hypothetical protein